MVPRPSARSFVSIDMENRSLPRTRCAATGAHKKLLPRNQSVLGQSVQGHSSGLCRKRGNVSLIHWIFHDTNLGRLVGCICLQERNPKLCIHQLMHRIVPGVHVKQPGPCSCCGFAALGNNMSCFPSLDALDEPEAFKTILHHQLGPV